METNLRAVQQFQLPWVKCIFLLIVGLLSSHVSKAVDQVSSSPRLILQLTVDQLRGDLPGRFIDRMGDAGFKYLYDNGVVYTDAHHAHANTETIVGHATLATGAHPADHGMVGNVWFDHSLNRLVYNIEDEHYHLLSSGADVDSKTEIDSTQKTAKSDGRSPHNILTSTFSDELALHTAGKAKVFGVSVKDRGAVSMAGHAGKAFWFSKSSGEFVTSSYYYKSNPPWVDAFNARKFPASYAGKSWELLGNKETYLYGAKDDNEWEMNFPGYGRVFPHPFGKIDDKYFTTLLTVSPVGDELTLAFAKELVKKEKIGKDDIPDFLSISFSSTDYVGHFFGPSSLEMEDNLLRLDRTLAELFTFIDKEVGLSNTLIVLSADHGGPEAPGLLKELGFNAEYVHPKEWKKEAGLKRLEKTFGVSEELIETYFHPYVYLNHALIKKKKLPMDEVRKAVAEEVSKLKGVSVAYSSSDIMQGKLPDNAVSRAIINNHNARRSGDVFVVFDPHFFINDFDGLEVCATHGSPWRYDTFVPLIFCGPNFQSQTISRKVHTVDVATTLSALLGTKPPSAASGQILKEVMERGSSLENK